METAPLKSFATWARTTLIGEVTARIAVVLAPGSSARVERSNVVAALEKAVESAGGTEMGRAAVADKVAYTWFNRIIALRFMDANGYTGIGVVSPERGRDNGQPEILAEAKRGNIDSDVISSPYIVGTVTSLLNGTRRSDDPQGEAFSLLLANYCRFWNRSMPFMFERESDFTELLMPANLLADDSVIARAVTVLTEEVCKDVEVIGWLYQFYISERKDEVFAGFKKNKKAGAAELPAATQLFTPHWIVRYLVENSLGRLWLLNRPKSRLIDQMDYYIAPIDKEADFLKLSSPEELKIIDPACGSGHMLTYAFDLLYAIYQEEGYAPSDIPGLILSHNLYGTEIDPRAGTLAAFALTMKGRARQRTFFNKPVEPNICVLQPISFMPTELDLLVALGGNRANDESFWNQFEHADTFGALIRPRNELIDRLRHGLDASVSDDNLLDQDISVRAARVVLQAEYLSRRYSIVVANPPYMGAGNMDANLSAWIKENYSDEKQDLYACFVSRGCLLARENGLVAMVIGDTWMTIKTFAEFRKGLLRDHTFFNFVHMHDVSNHPDIFGANAAFVFSNRSTPQQTCTFVYLEPLSAEAKRTQLLEAIRNPDSPWSYRIQTEQFDAVPGAPFAFRLSDSMRKVFKMGDPLGQNYAAMNGMTTGENARFLRLWHEVPRDRLCLDATDAASAADSGARWFPYNKGGAYRKWFGNAEHVINWEADGRDVVGYGRAFTRGRKYYFKQMVSWGKVSSGLPSFRYFSPGFLFDVAGTSMFADSPDDLLEALAFCNSVVAQKLLEALSPTLNYESGQISSLPVIRDTSGRVREIAKNLVDMARDDWESYEGSWNFQRPLLLTYAPDSTTLAEACTALELHEQQITAQAKRLEEENNSILLDLYGVAAEADPTVVPGRVSLNSNPEYRFGAGKSSSEYTSLVRSARVADFVSFAVGCMFGRYSLDEPGLVLADQGGTVQDYLSKVPNPSFRPDTDNVIPIVDGDWFEDDIVTQFRRFLRVTFGEEHFEKNLRFVTESLGVKDLRDYFVKSFYKDHVQRYKKRPIYWLFSSPKGSFNALIYLHRYTSSTVSTVLNEYLREFKAKLAASRQHHERLAAGTGTAREKAAAQKEVDRLRKVLLELDEYEHDVLYPLATQQIQIDLDDGVKANYPKFGTALKKIVGLEAKDD